MKNIKCPFFQENRLNFGCESTYKISHIEYLNDRYVSLTIYLSNVTGEKVPGDIKKRIFRPSRGSNPGPLG